jgi:hypothetical protein
VAVPLFIQCTGEQVNLHAKKILDILCPEWKSIMLSITTGGEKNDWTYPRSCYQI